MPAAAPGDPAERFRYHRALRSLLAMIARERPVALLFDDVHWADEASVELVLHLLRRPPAGPVLLGFAMRPVDPARRLLDAVGYPVEEVVAALQTLTEEYDEQGRGFELRNVAGGWRYYTREEYASVVETFVLEGQQARTPPRNARDRARRQLGSGDPGDRCVRDLPDGAGPVRQFFSITVPMISGAIFFNVVVLTIAALQVFDQAYLLFWRDQTNASPDSSLFYGVYLFQQAFRSFDFGFAAAMAWLLFVIVLVITLVQVKLSNRFVYYEGDR